MKVVVEANNLSMFYVEFPQGTDPETYNYDIFSTDHFYFYTTHLSVVNNPSDLNDFETNFKASATSVGSRDDALALADPPVNELLVPQVEVVTRLGKPGHVSYTLVSHSWSDKTTWWQYALKMGVNEDGSQNPYVLTVQDDPTRAVWQADMNDRTWINIRHPKLTLQEYNDGLGNLYAVLQKDGTFKSLNEYFVLFFYRTAAVDSTPAGPWIQMSEDTDLNNVDYVNGTITLNVGLQATQELGAIFYKSQSSKFIMRPPAGKVWRFTDVEMNKTSGPNFQFDGGIPRFRVWVDPTYQYNIPQLIAYRAVYPSIFNIQNTAMYAWPPIVASGGTSAWPPNYYNGFSDGFTQGSQYDMHIFHWEFKEQPFELKSSQHVSLMLDLVNDVPLNTEYASFTIWVAQDDE